AMDATALNHLESLHDQMRRHGRQLILSSLHTQPYALIEMSRFFDELGWVNLLADLDAVVARAWELTDSRSV
ncbi:MAG TPA: STAS domain-containing protein, partial [Opitutaceae bacterium]